MNMYDARERVAIPVALRDEIGAGTGIEMLHLGALEGLAGRSNCLSFWIGK
jgi:hypothetical protein